MLSWFKNAERHLTVEESQNEDEFATRIPYHIESEDIPRKAQEFYEDFGKLRHQVTNDIIPKLAPYQEEIYDCQALTVFVDKCQKSGLTTSELLHDFNETITIGRGKDCLIGAQTQQHANEHIYTLKRMIADSEKYRKYLITNSRELFFREEQTKLSTIFIKNPDNPFRPSRIIGLPFRQQSFWSWKNAFRVHLSDPAITNVVNDAGVYAAAKGRLANTNGRMMIEGPPNGPNNKFYEYYEQYKDNHDKDFQVFLIIDEDAIAANVISREFLEGQKRELGPLYPQYYQGSFLVGVGNLFIEEQINRALELGAKYRNLKINPFAVHYGGIDPESEAAVYVGELDIDNQIIRLVVAKHFPRTITPYELATEVHDIHEQIPNTYWFVDGNHRGYINELKVMFDEDLDWTQEKDYDDDTRINPVNFRMKHADMLTNMWNYVDREMLAVPEDLEDCSYLVKAMRTAKHKAFHLDKKQTMNSDDLDAVRLLLEGVKIDR